MFRKARALQIPILMVTSGGYQVSCWFALLVLYEIPLLFIRFIYFNCPDQ